MLSFRKYIGYVPSPIWMHMLLRNIPHLKSKLHVFTDISCTIKLVFYFLYNILLHVMWVVDNHLKGKWKTFLVISALPVYIILWVKVFSSCLSSLTWQVLPQLSCPLALFSYYNPILKRGVKKFMYTVKEVGVHGNLLIAETFSFSIEPFHLPKY